MDKCKQTHGIDVCIYKEFTNFGIIKVSEQLRPGIVNQTQVLETILLSSIQHNEVLVDDIESNKYQTPKSPSQSATLLVHKIDNKVGNIIHERTLIMENSNSTDRIFVVAFEDLPENYESGQSQEQLKEIFDSFRFL